MVAVSQRPGSVLQVNLLIPISYLMFWVVLLGFSLYSDPVVCGLGMVIMLTGVPVYVVGVWWKDKPKWISRAVGKLTSSPSHTHTHTHTRASAVVSVLSSLVLCYREDHICGPEGVLRGVSSGRPFRVGTPQLLQSRLSSSVILNPPTTPTSVLSVGRCLFFFLSFLQTLYSQRCQFVIFLTWSVS